MNNSPKIALIGLGYWGKNLARNLYDLKVLNGICDNNADNLDKYKIRKYVKKWVIIISLYILYT